MTFPSSSLRAAPALEGPPRSQNVLNYLLPIIKCVKEAGRESRSDLSTRWVHGLLISLTYGLVIALIEVVLWSILHVSISACRPDGTFSIYNDYSPWGIAGFFQINVAFGSLTFTQAKVIDTVWDVVVGRVGQSILAFFLWQSIANYVTVSMETKPTTYAVFFILFLHDGPSFLSICRLLQNFVRYRGLRSKLSTAWILLSMIFVLAWPTLISAMSGYTPETDAYAQDIDGNLVKFTEFRLLNYVIHDGWRIGLDGDYPVTATRPSDVLLDKTSDPLRGEEDNGCVIIANNDNTWDLCYLRHNISAYTSLYGFNGRNDTPSLWLNKTIPSPSLNIEAFYIAPHLYDYKTPSQWAWTYANNTYDLQDMQKRGSCKPTGDIFKWGFSFWQLFIVLALLLTWSVGTYRLWAKARSILPPQEQPEQRRGLKALLLLAETTRGELERHGIDVHSLTNKELKREIHKTLNGGSISFNICLGDIQSPRRSLLKWVARELHWWLLNAGLIVAGSAFHTLYFAAGLGDVIRSAFALGYSKNI
ncbi:hypothetical protein CHU98_g7765 [Xylaria longipes]|nr:hypothetical protein CHU98_g7765 [Xylaria longipes]